MQGRTDPADNKTYISRSAMACYQECPRRRLLHYLLDNVGYVPVGANVYFSTGSAVHKGIEFLLRGLKNNPEHFIWDKQHLPRIREYREQAVKVATGLYKELTKDGIVGGKLGSTPEIQDYTFKEQIAIVEALVRAWAYKELPLIAKRFKIVAVEFDTHATLVDNIILEGKADALLQDKETKDILVYSLKTIKNFDWRAEKNYKTDLQGITEIWLTEQHLKHLKATIARYKGISTRVQGVKFCFLIKGTRKEVKDDKGKGTGLWTTDNALIKGYRKFEANRLEYAHSFWYYNNANKSGKGRLGKGWESFNVWEAKDLRVKGWMDLLVRKQIQPELGDVVKEYVVTPEEYWRDKQEIAETITELQIQEKEVAAKANGTYVEPLFPRYRGSCWYPQDCDFAYKGRICPSIPEFKQLVEEGEYVARTPHHKMELLQIQNMEAKTE